jgi:hypothetical protein
MYYIINETNQIIAADESLLALCGVMHINELNSNIILEKLTFNILSDNQLIITISYKHHTFSITSTLLSSLLGKLTLIILDTDNQTRTNEVVENIDINSLIIKTDSPNETLTIMNDIEKEIDIKKEEVLFEISPKESEDLDNHTLYGLSDSTNEKEEEISPRPKIIIDIVKVSKEIGISKEDFNLFLNEYIDTALDLEQDLQNSDNETRSSAIQTLLHLGEVLHLDVFDNILKNIHTSSNTTQTAFVSSFYDALSCMTTSDVDEVHIDMPFSIEKIKSNSGDKPPKIETVIDTIGVDSIEIQTGQEVTSFGKINLSKVEAIHFDFQLSAATDELSLPKSLIEEFMIDFVEQAHTETEKMLVAYKKGDLKTINNIAHLLKGVSSNLRITPLSDTLHQIQFCEKPNNLKYLIKNYWGHFLFFEKQINMLSN